MGKPSTLSPIMYMRALRNRRRPLGGSRIFWCATDLRYSGSGGAYGRAVWNSNAFISTFCISSSPRVTQGQHGGWTISAQALNSTFSSRGDRFLGTQKRYFHDYFTTVIPPPRGSGNFLATGGPPQPPPQSSKPSTIIRIPLKGAKQHFGHIRSRGNRPYNEDWFQAGVLDLPRHLKTSAPYASDINSNSHNSSLLASNSVFYYAAFDGHGGEECSHFLKDKLHEYIESAAQDFYPTDPIPPPAEIPSATGDAIWDSIAEVDPNEVPMDEKQLQQNHRKQLQADLISHWRQTVGGYFRRFKPDFSGPSAVREPALAGVQGNSEKVPPIGVRGMLGTATGDGSWESILTYAFLRADLDFITGKWQKGDSAADGKNPAISDKNGENARLKSGSTASIALLFTPPKSNDPYWSPTATSTLITAHVGDTRIILSNSITGEATPLTSLHHPSHPYESRRLRRYSTAFISDSFGEERFGILANTRSFGDATQKRLGITAEPEVARHELRGTDWSFMVLCSDGVSGVLSDQEIVDIVKECDTPDEGAREVVKFAEEVVERNVGGGDNATCLVVRLGGWEERESGGMGSRATRQLRKWRMENSAGPARRQ